MMEGSDDEEVLVEESVESDLESTTCESHQQYASEVRLEYVHIVLFLFFDGLRVFCCTIRALCEKSQFSGTPFFVYFIFSDSMLRIGGLSS